MVHRKGTALLTALYLRMRKLEKSDDQAVWYDLYAFSRPSTLASLAYPFARALQKRFARDSRSALPRPHGSTQAAQKPVEQSQKIEGKQRHCSSPRRVAYRPK